MKRTQNRPLVTGQISKKTWVYFCFVDFNLLGFADVGKDFYVDDDRWTDDDVNVFIDVHAPKKKQNTTL